MKVLHFFTRLLVNLSIMGFIGFMTLMLLVLSIMVAEDAHRKISNEVTAVFAQQWAVWTFFTALAGSVASILLFRINQQSYAKAAAWISLVCTGFLAVEFISQSNMRNSYQVHGTLICYAALTSLGGLATQLRMKSL